jgi:uncharacterized protein YdeI (YjbR/CyaY-like superfamily)
MTQSDIPILSFTSADALVAHMKAQPSESRGFWIRLSKQGAPASTISKQDAIESALCCGWIDGQLRKCDEHYYLIKMTPRRRGSRWSANNRDTADRLAQEGRLTPAGLREVEQAKEDGRWAAAYQSQGKAEPPVDFMLALERNEKAARFFEALDRANRYAFIYRVSEAKRPETRAKRIAEFVEMLARGETFHPRKGGAGKARG